MAVRTSWLIGSAYIPQTTLVVDGSPYVWPAGHYYLRHPIAALSMVGTLQSILFSAAIVGAAVTLTKDRRVKVSFDVGADFTFAWPLGNYIRDLLGFNVTIGSNTSQVAANISPLLWSPQKNEAPGLAPLGVRGQEVSDAQFSTSPDGIQFVREHHTQVINSFDWESVPMDRFQTPSALGGEYTVFYRQVFRKAQKCYLYRDLNEVDGSTENVEWTDSPLGPYGLRPGRGGITAPFSRTRGLTRVDRRVDISVDVLVVPEWGS